MIACMGGWCTKRGKCAHYHADGLARRAPVERLCGVFQDEPVPMYHPVKNSAPKRDLEACEVKCHDTENTG